MTHLPGLFVRKFSHGGIVTSDTPLAISRNDYIPRGIWEKMVAHHNVPTKKLSREEVEQIFEVWAKQLEKLNRE